MNQMLESPNDPILQEDLNNIANSNAPLDTLSGCTLFVTGATGLIGSLIVKSIACYNRLKNTNIKVLALARNADKARKIYGDILTRPEIKLIIGDINDKLTVDGEIDYIIHGAGPTASKYFVTNPVETIKTTMHGTENVLELAKEKKIKSMVYLSSMEVYGQAPAGKTVLAEEDLGYIDILNIRSSYSEGKRMAECLCASYASEYNVPVKIARLSRVFGPGFVDYNDQRILMQLAKNIMMCEDIILHTNGETLINYCYTSDAIIAIFYILISVFNINAYNVSNQENVFSLKVLSNILVDTFTNNKIKVTTQVSKDSTIYGYNIASSYILDNTKMSIFNNVFKTDIINTFSRTINSIRNAKDQRHV